MSKTKAPIFSLHQALDRHPLKVSPNMPLKAVVELMSQESRHCHTALNGGDADEPLSPAQHPSCVLVMDGERLSGILTEKDIVRLIAADTPLAERAAAHVMAHPVITLPAEGNLDIFAALNIMRRHKIHHLPVVDIQGQVTGLLTPKRLRSLMEPADFMRFRLVQEVMNTEVVHALPTDSVLQIVRQLIEHRVSCVVIVAAADERSQTSRGRSRREPTASSRASSLVRCGYRRNFSTRHGWMRVVLEQRRRDTLRLDL
ncbi:MAG: CBS domain-containing protein [Phormidesmis sp.]